MTDVIFPLVAGHVALDLLNTVSWRLDPVRRTEGLEAYPDVLAWAAQARVLTVVERDELADRAARAPEAAAAETAAFHALREAAYTAVVERDATQVERVVAQHLEALSRAELVAVGDHWRWAEPEPALTIPRDRMARTVVSLLTSPDLAALHQCEDDACGWVYLDTSPRRNRRWCVAADCGNRNRARAFYARQRTARQAV